jgi:hypothetical protein
MQVGLSSCCRIWPEAAPLGDDSNFSIAQLMDEAGRELIELIMAVVFVEASLKLWMDCRKAALPNGVVRQARPQQPFSDVRL